MNGVWNAIFVVSIFMLMTAFAWVYSLGDKILVDLYAVVNGIEPNSMTDSGLTLWTGMRDFSYQALNHFLLPFLMFLALTSSFINRNRSLHAYIIQALGVVLITPILIYVFADIITAMTSVSFINTSYLFSTYTANFLYILVGNMLLTLASFVFIQKSVQYA